jgi:hypothetical protein
MRVIGATESRFFTARPFITIGVKSELVSISIGPDLQKHETGALSTPKPRVRDLLTMDLATVQETQKTGWTISSVSFIVKIWISRM